MIGLKTVLWFYGSKDKTSMVRNDKSSQVNRVTGRQINGWAVGLTD